MQDKRESFQKIEEHLEQLVSCYFAVGILPCKTEKMVMTSLSYTTLIPLLHSVFLSIDSVLKEVFTSLENECFSTSEEKEQVILQLRKLVEGVLCTGIRPLLVNYSDLPSFLDEVVKQKKQDQTTSNVTLH